MPQAMQYRDTTFFIEHAFKEAIFVLGMPLFRTRRRLVSSISLNSKTNTIPTKIAVVSKNNFNNNIYQEIVFLFL
jgi:hypothetical protein